MTLGFTDKMLAKMRAGEELRVSGDRIDPFTYTIHAAKKVLSLLTSQAPFGIYHIANQGSVSYYEFICAFANKIGFSGEITRTGRERDHSALNPLRAELGSTKVRDMPSWSAALDEYVRDEKISI